MNFSSLMLRHLSGVLALMGLSLAVLGSEAHAGIQFNYTFIGNSLASSDSDANSTASELGSGILVPITDPLRGNPAPSRSNAFLLTPSSLTDTLASNTDVGLLFSGVPDNFFLQADDDRSDSFVDVSPTYDQASTFNANFIAVDWSGLPGNQNPSIGTRSYNFDNGDLSPFDGLRLDNIVLSGEVMPTLGLLTSLLLMMGGGFLLWRLG